MSGPALARAAASLVGAPFRLHGRDPATGLDCVGVLAAALDRIGRRAPLPTGYALRTRAVANLDGLADRAGLQPAHGPALAGDILLLRCAPCQLHLAIVGEEIVGEEPGFIHAHARLGRVVFSKGAPPWPVTRHWRIAPR